MTHGPRAVLNALDRLADSYPGQRAATAQDLAIAQGQLRDHQARLGTPFAHDAYLAELTHLRDQLKAGLSQATPEPDAPPVAELAERIKSLKAAHTIDAAPERTAPRRIAAEEPVTARIRRRPSRTRRPGASRTRGIAGGIPPAETAPPAAEEQHSVIALFPDGKPPVARPEPGYRQHVARQRQDSRQLSLF